MRLKTGCFVLQPQPSRLDCVTAPSCSGSTGVWQDEPFLRGKASVLLTRGLNIKANVIFRIRDWKILMNYSVLTSVPRTVSSPPSVEVTGPPVRIIDL